MENRAQSRMPAASIRLDMDQLAFVQQLVIVLTEETDDDGNFIASDKSKAVRLCIDACRSGDTDPAIVEARKRITQTG